MRLCTSEVCNKKGFHQYTGVMVGLPFVGFPTGVMNSLWAGWVLHGRSGAMLRVFALVVSTYMSQTST